jgi:hypothetical protein
MLMFGQGRDFLAGKACHVFDIVQRNHPPMIAWGEAPLPDMDQCQILQPRLGGGNAHWKGS